MNLFRCTIIGREGGVSFIADAEALPALLVACGQSPRSVQEALHLAEPYYHGLEERILNGLAVFDERNVPGNYAAIHQTLSVCAPHEQPPFRVVDDETREASLQPVKAGAILFNLREKRIVQLQNSYGELTRYGRGRIWDGETLTSRVFRYSLPREWAIVP